MATENPDALVFVYNADSGLFNTVADIGHKLFLGVISSAGGRTDRR